MIIVMNPNCSENEVLKVKGELESKGLGIHLSQGETFCIIGVMHYPSLLSFALHCSENMLVCQRKKRYNMFGSR